MNDPLDASCLPYYEALDMPIWTFDVQRLRKTWANAAAVRYWQADSLTDLLERECSVVVASIQSRLDEAMQAQARGEPMRAVWHAAVPGGDFRCELLTRGYRFEDGRVGLLFFAERPTADELQVVQRLLADARQAASAADAAKAAFLANVSHEIRTPMNGVLGLTSLSLRSAELNERQRRFISMAHESARRLMAIIDDLLDTARVESGEMRIDARPFAVRACIADVLATLEATARAKGVRFAWHIDDALPDTLIGDDIRLRQVLLHLVGNALKFTPVGDVGATVAVEPNAALAPNCVQLCIEVRDTGIGMNDAQLDRIFEPFVQADASASRRYGGIGLGLTLVAGLVALMGGTVRAESTPGVGTCFKATVVLERVELAQTEDALRSAKGVGPASG